MSNVIHFDFSTAAQAKKNLADRKKDVQEHYFRLGSRSADEMPAACITIEVGIERAAVQAQAVLIEPEYVRAILDLLDQMREDLLDIAPAA